MELPIHLSKKSVLSPKTHRCRSVSKMGMRIKEMENRSVISLNDIDYEWTQESDKIVLTATLDFDLLLNNVNVSANEEQLTVAFSNGRKLKINIFDSIVTDDIQFTSENNSFTITLIKCNSINWSSLERVTNSTPLKCSNTCNTDESAPMKNGESSSEEVVTDSCKENIVQVVNPKTNFVERNDDLTVFLYLYVNNINKETFSITFQENMFSALFSTSEESFLRKYPKSTENTVFKWSMHTKGKIIPNQCSYRLNVINLELKLKKINTDLWDSPTLSTSNSDSGVVMRNTWVPASKSESKKVSNIPPAPPAPPTPPAFNEVKKPTSLVSTNKAISNSSNLSGFSLSSNIGQSAPVCARGMTGLDNIGNTCFMNSVLQCLVNTRELRDYFTECKFQDDLNKENPLGMGGKLALSFALLMKFLWSGTTKTFAPTKLKSIMSQKANQFTGFAQHDAQEFMVELLDGLHEDLNRIKRKPYIADPPDLDGWTDHEAAEESWRLHKMRNDSIIDDLFKGQFKSTLQCHECEKISVKFDEFCCLSVPIPKDLKSVQVVFFWRDTLKIPKKFFIRVSADALIDELKQQLSLHTRVSPAAIQVMEASKSKIHKIFGKGSSTHLSSVVSSDTLMAFEVLTEKEAGEPVIELAVTQRMTTPNPPNKCASCARTQDILTTGTKLKRCTKCYRVGYCNTTCQKNHWHHHKQYCKLMPEPVGSPFIMSLPESGVTYANLMQLAENYARYSVDIFQPPVGQSQNRRRRHGSTSSGDISSDAEEMEVDSEGSGDAKECDTGGAYSGEDRAEADWPLCGGASGGGPSGTNYAGVRSAKVNRSNSLSSSSSGGGDDIPLLSSSPKGKAVAPQRTLTPVTRLFTLRPVNIKAQNMTSPHSEPLNDKGAEPLNLKDIQFLAMDWCTNERLPVRCLIQNKEIECETEEEKNVQKNRNTTIEACIDLFTQPENLSEGDSWRCPRCKKPVEATKQMSIWRLPSVLIVQLKRFSFKYVLYSDKIDKFVQYPIRSLDMGPFLSERSPEGPAIYDLYGVINHMGRLLGGHYTAYCRTLDAEDTRQSEIDWRLCDDSRVNFANESRVVHEQAYLLLYRRRGDSFKVFRPLSLPAPTPSSTPSLKKGAEENPSDEEDEAFESNDNGSKPQLFLEPMEESTPLSLSSSGSEPPSTVQEELD